MDNPAAPRNAAFLAIHAAARPYENYEEAPQLRGACVPMAVMMHRWDGRIGFPGGYAEEGEEPLQTALREAFEEIQFSPAEGELSRIALIDERMAGPNTRAFLFALEVDSERFCSILRQSACAPHAIAEGWAFPARFSNDPAPAFDNLMACALAPAVKEECAALAALIAPELLG